ncbi:metallophosphoesterase [Lacinutrix chionoecetis]
MNLNVIKHTNPYVISLLICFNFCSLFKSFAQETNFLKAIKKDSVFIKKEFNKGQRALEFNGNDGPYIINDTLLYSVNTQNRLTVTPFFNRDSIAVIVDNKAKDTFYIGLEKGYTTPNTVYSSHDKVMVISDIEGNFNAFYSFLYANKIIDKNYNWIYGNGHLVLGGDFVDRGTNVTQVLWLIYKLDHQAKKQKGTVHFILGNHEILNFYGDHRYNDNKYIKVAQEISQIADKKEAISYLYSNESELGKWLATKNVVEKIGSYLFVHAGLSTDILSYNMDLKAINERIRSRFNGIQDPKDKTLNFLYGAKGPFWYRGLVRSRIQYDKIKLFELDKILKYYNAEKIVVGHTPVPEISTDFNGKVIRTDVLHGSTKFSGETKGLLIEKGVEFIVDDTGNKTLLQNKL